MLDLRAALGGRWASNVQGWLLMFFPSFLLVLLQESTRGVPSATLLVSSTLAQHLAAGAIVGVTAALARRKWAILPIPVLIAMWVALGVGRGVAGGLACIAWGDGAGEFSTRITFWISISLVWMPLLTFTAAQLDNRRSLIVARDHACELRDDALLRSRESTGELSARLVGAIRDAIGPAIEDISRSLGVLGPRLPPETFRAVGDRIAAVSRDADSIIAEGSPAEPMPAYTPPSGTTLLGAAIRFERERPVFTGFLVGLAVAAVIVPNAFIADGVEDVVEGLFTVGFTTVALMSLLLVQERIARRTLAHSVALLATAAVLAGLLGSLMLLYVNYGLMDSYDWMLAAILPPGVTAATLAISTAVGLATANIQTELETRRLLDEAAELEHTTEERVERVRAGLTQVLHGPLQGRLAACVMALTFHAEEPDHSDSERSGFVARSVMEHLESVSRDLDALAASGVVERRPVDSS